MTTAPAPRISDDVEAVVLAYGPESYGGVVRELVEQGMPPTQITVVQNPKVAGEPDLPEDPAGIRVLRMARNDGYGPAMNAALRAPRGPARWMLLLTHDVEFDPGAVAALVAAAEGDDRHGILSPVLRWTGDHATSGNRTFGGVWDHGGRVALLDAPGPRDDRGIASCAWADGSVLLVRLEASAAVDHIDERYFLYYEETDLCLRVGRAGWEVGCVVASECSQAAGPTRRPGAYAYLMTRNRAEFARRVGGPRAALREATHAFFTMPLRRLARRTTTRQERRAAVQATIGTLGGLVAFALRRFGPPPRRLPGMGDVKL